MGFNLFDYDESDDAKCEWCGKGEGKANNPIYEHDSGIGFAVPMHQNCYRTYTENLDPEKEYDWKKDKKKEFADKKASKRRMVTGADDEDSGESEDGSEGSDEDSEPSQDDNSSGNATTASRDFYIDDNETPWVSRDLPLYRDSSIKKEIWYNFVKEDSPFLD